MVRRCHLIGVNNIPDQVLDAGQSLVIGRNRQCRIRDIQCSRNYCTVSFAGGNSLHVVYTKPDTTEDLTSGSTLKGTGFQYRIAFVEHPTAMSKDSFDSDSDSDFGLESLEPPKTTSSEETSSETEWSVLESGRVHVCRFMGGGRSSQLVAAFDFDGTLVETKSGLKFAQDSNDWRLLDKSLPKRLAKLTEDGYRFVVVSNQLPISQRRTTAEDIYKRFESALTAIGVPCLVMIAAYDDIYRKPRPGLWQLLSDKFNSQSIDLKSSFFVGDAAGRKKQLNGRSDHSSADLLFAANCCLPFLTPERFLNDVKPKGWDPSKTSYAGLEVRTFRPMPVDESHIAVDSATNRRFKTVDQLLEEYSGKLHVIVMCGLAASGKTSFYSNHLQRFGYFCISRDTLKTMEKCRKTCATNLQNQTNCVIDNTNVEVEARKAWTELCRKHNATALLFHFDVSVAQSLHNNIFRRIIGVNSPVTELVIRSQNKHFVKPTAGEGFDAIYKINFVPHFSTEEQKTLYFSYLFER